MSVVDSTVLFQTDTHLHYLTQEKGGTAASTRDQKVWASADSVSATGTVLSFNSKGREQTQRYSLIGALSDRILLATQDKSKPSGVRFLVRPVSLLEPLLLGYLSSISQSKIQQELDRDLVKQAC